MKKKYGISLVALVITIIVLLILVGAIIMLAGGENGLIARTQRAVEASNIATVQEKIILEVANIKIDAAPIGKTVSQYINENNEIREELISKDIIVEITDTGIIFTVDDYNVITDPNGKIIETTKSNTIQTYAFEKVLGDASLWTVEPDESSEDGAYRIIGYIGEAWNNPIIPNTLNIQGVGEKRISIIGTAEGEPIDGFDKFSGIITAANSLTFSTLAFQNLKVIGDEDYDEDDNTFIITEGVSKIVFGHSCCFGVEDGGPVTWSENIQLEFGGNTKIGECCHNGIFTFTQPIIELSQVSLSLVTLSPGDLEFVDGAIIAPVACQNNSTLTSLTFGKNSFIGNMAFNGSENLETIVMKDNVICEDSNTFGGCQKLKTITIGKNCQIGVVNFTGCENIDTLTIGDGTVIGDCAFQTASIKNTTFGDNVTVCSVAFNEAISESVSLGKNMVIEESAFLRSLGITTLEIKEGTTVGNGAFAECTNLQTLVIGPNVVIGEKVFENCTSLTNVTISPSATVAGNAFEGCTSYNS